MKDPQVLISSFSPCCNIEAFLEQDDNTCYFYLWINPNTEESELKSCFVSNVTDKANAISMNEWKESDIQGPPMIPYEHVTHSTDGLTFDEDLLEIVWTMEGSGAGLLYNDELIAFIPEWSNKEFCGFSRYVKGQTLYGCDMTQAEENLNNQIKRGKHFWSLMDGDYWSDFQQSHLSSIEDYIGKTDKYYAIDGGEFPPKALVTGEKDDILYGLTLGVSILRQPNVESFYQEKTKDFSRVEIGFACAKEYEPCFMDVLQQLSGATNIPWHYITSLGHGHTIRNKAIEGFPAFWLINANLLGEDSSPKYDLAFGERVNLLWAVPITQEEYDFLLEYDMQKIFDIKLDDSIHIFDGNSKVPLELLKSL